ncbi:thiopeptide-type bacteriocin biosynthesis protein [Actinokineospora cianjurensis]|uniref:Thiopeptide-type bacteriocin biosynthesis protein n=1 Tax=Actinokineospora cianjurensis TaxID=585224 RepID=A0A421AXE0_9PSEU|nr:thiopeptide-type bacteriocin biosynthesis protein [Actinokineospora cianjurensis]RLK54458.1 thiopeptide-type bacteriocin biosynthesis protein [Actinokineospora cianjurensis]
MGAGLDIDTGPDDTGWAQVAVRIDDYATAEHVGTTHLGPLMASAEHAGLITCWWFVRKNPYWRLRWRPVPGTAHEANHVVQRALDTLRGKGIIAETTATIYEPEIHAFGGEKAMDLAHRLFHADSTHLLDHLAGDRGRGPSPGEKRRELTVLLCSNLMRAAGQDWYEQGDIWARVADNRPLPASTSADQVHAAVAGLQRLMTVDASPTSPLLQPGGSLAHVTGWATAFDTAGQHLGRLARAGTLRRGVRAVLAHHVLFHWNRLGLPHDTQALIAHTAKTVVLGT